MNIGQIMKQSVEACGPADTLHRAAQIMWDHDCGCVPVVDAERHVVGMITDRDICMAAYTRGVPLAALRVSEVISKTLFSCRPDDLVSKAERLMSNYQVHRLPVVDAEGYLVGILSLSDIAEEAACETARKKKDVTLTQVGELIEAISRPRISVPLANGG